MLNAEKTMTIYFAYPTLWCVETHKSGYPKKTARWFFLATVAEKNYFTGISLHPPRQIYKNSNQTRFDPCRIGSGWSASGYLVTDLKARDKDWHPWTTKNWKTVLKMLIDALMTDDEDWRAKPPPTALLAQLYGIWKPHKTKRSKWPAGPKTPETPSGNLEDGPKGDPWSNWAVIRRQVSVPPPYCLMGLTPSPCFPEKWKTKQKLIR